MNSKQKLIFPEPFQKNYLYLRYHPKWSDSEELRKCTPLPLQSHDSWMSVKENPDRKKKTPTNKKFWSKWVFNILQTAFWFSKNKDALIKEMVEL